MKLSELLDQEVTKLSEDFRKFNFEDLNHYAAWAGQHHRLIQSTPHLLHLCTANVDVTDTELFDEFEHHLEEEKKHDLLLLNDFKRLGFNLLDYEASPPAIAIIDLQHYYINKYGPLVFLGYALLLEGLAYKIGADLSKRVTSTHKKKSVFLDLHVQSDETHYPDGLERIDKFITSKREKEAFIRNMKVASYNYSAMMVEAQNMTKNMTVKKAA